MAARALGDMVHAICGYDGDAASLQLAAKMLASGAPFSAALVAAIQELARPLALAEVFRLQLSVLLRCGTHVDFFEGARALLADLRA
jgi:enoyl-CoA hydratase/carnithine racemase